MGGLLKNSSVLSGLIYPGTSGLKLPGDGVLVGLKVNIFANSEKIFANDDKIVLADGTSQSIEAWFDYMNEEFDKLYEIYT